MDVPLGMWIMDIVIGTNTTEEPIMKKYSITKAYVKMPEKKADGSMTLRKLRLILANATDPSEIAKSQLWLTDTVKDGARADVRALKRVATVLNIASPTTPAIVLGKVSELAGHIVYLVKSDNLDASGKPYVNVMFEHEFEDEPSSTEDVLAGCTDIPAEL